MHDIRPKLNQYEIELILEAMKKAKYDEKTWSSPEKIIFRRFDALAGHRYGLSRERVLTDPKLRDRYKDPKIGTGKGSANGTEENMVTSVPKSDNLRCPVCGKGGPDADHEKCIEKYEDSKYPRHYPGEPKK